MGDTLEDIDEVPKLVFCVRISGKVDFLMVRISDIDTPIFMEISRLISAQPAKTTFICVLSNDTVESMGSKKYCLRLIKKRDKVLNKNELYLVAYCLDPVPVRVESRTC
jgi:hypothetical protein